MYPRSKMFRKYVVYTWFRTHHCPLCSTELITNNKIYTTVLPLALCVCARVPQAKSLFSSNKTFWLANENEINHQFGFGIEIVAEIAYRIRLRFRFYLGTIETRLLSKTIEKQKKAKKIKWKSGRVRKRAGQSKSKGGILAGEFHSHM